MGQLGDMSETAASTTHEHVPKARADARRAALRAFMTHYSLQAASWARKAGLSTPNQLYGFLNGDADSLSVPVLESLARAIERPIGELLGEIPPGAGSLMDAGPIDSDLLASIMSSVDTALKSSNRTLPNDKKARAVALLYKRFSRAGETTADEQTVTDYIQLAVDNT